MQRGAVDPASHDVAGALPDHVVVLGASGLLGHVVYDTMITNVAQVTGVMRRSREHVAWWPPFSGSSPRARLIDGIEASDWSVLVRLLDELRPDTIVNCVGVTPRRSDASDTVAAIRINALLPHLLAEWASTAGCRLITVSTDCVFGHEPGGFTESSVTNASDLYGRTKALGEVTNESAVTIRTSFVGLELVNRTELLEWFLGHANGQVAGYGNVWYSGVPAAMVAAVVLMLTGTHRDVVGLHHLAAPEPISKLDLLRAANDAFESNVTIVPDGAPASHRTLDGSGLHERLSLGPVDWQGAFTALARDHRYDLREPARVDP